MTYYYEKELKALNKNRIKYLVIGGLAVNLYGLHRLTYDLDLMLDLSEDNFEKFKKTIGKLHYKTNIPPDKWKTHAAIAFLNQKDQSKRIDAFLKNPIDFKKAYRARELFKIGDLKISCVSLVDLVRLKSKADRVRDWVDIGSLKRMQELKKRK